MRASVVYTLNGHRMWWSGVELEGEAETRLRELRRMLRSKHGDVVADSARIEARVKAKSRRGPKVES